MNKHSDIQGERIAWSHFWINKGLIAVEVLLFFYIENLIRKSLGEYEFRNNSVLLLQTPFQIFQKKIFLQVLVSKSAGKYCVGDQVTMADCYLVPQVYNANRFKVDMKQFPNINTIVQNLEKVKAFITTHPENQPDKQ